MPRCSGCLSGGARGRLFERLQCSASARVDRKPYTAPQAIGGGLLKRRAQTGGPGISQTSTDWGPSGPKPWGCTRVLRVWGGADSRWLQNSRPPRHPTSPPPPLRRTRLHPTPLVTNTSGGVAIVFLCFHVFVAAKPQERLLGTQRCQGNPKSGCSVGTQRCQPCAGIRAPGHVRPTQPGQAECQSHTVTL